MCANPFFSGLTHNDYNGDGYLLKLEDEAVTSYPDQEWVYDQSQNISKIQEPKEYRQSLSRIMNGLIKEGFLLNYFSEIKSNDPDSLPGSWGHFADIAPPWIEFNWYYYPNIATDYSLTALSLGRFSLCSKSIWRKLIDDG